MSCLSPTRAPDSTTTEVAFCQPHSTLQLRQKIGSGKYGVVYAAFPLSASSDEDDDTSSVDSLQYARQVFAVKESRHSSTSRFELAAYRRIARTLKVDSRRQGIKGKSEDFADVKWHPLLSGLLGAVFRPKDTDFSGSRDYIVKLSKESEDKLTRNYGSGRFYLLFDLYDGGSFEEFAWDPRPFRSMTLSEACFYLAELGEALLFLHESAGILHHDIKPGNLLVRSDGHIVLTDFGLACLSDSPTGPVLPSPGTVKCTSGHMPPEVRCFPPGDVNVWQAVDWYSAGVILHRLVSSSNYPIAATSADVHLTDLKAFKRPLTQSVSPLGQNLIDMLLFPNPELRLGGSLTKGGSEVFLHKGFLESILDTRPGTNYSSRAMCNLGSSPVTAFLSANLLSQLRSAVSQPHVPLADNHDWLCSLRWAIRNQMLIPPFLPTRSCLKHSEYD